MIMRLFQCFNKIHIHTPEYIYTPERRPSDVFSPSQSRKESIYNYNLFQKTLEQKLKEIHKIKI